MTTEPDIMTIFVGLVDEDVDVWRPVRAVRVGANVYRVLPQEVPASERWAFQPEDEVLCESILVDGGPILAAVRRRTAAEE